MSEESKLLEQLLELEKARFSLDRPSFLDWAKRVGRARLDVGGTSLTIPAEDSVSFTTTNPSGYVWIPHIEATWVETANVLTVTTARDGVTIWEDISIPAEYIINWEKEVPWWGAGIMRHDGTTTIANSDTSDRWIIVAWLGTYLAMSEYDAFIARTAKYFDKYRRPL